MPLLSVADLVTTVTAADALSLELSIAASLGLPSTAWQPLSPEMAILGTNAQLISTYSVTINQIAQGGFPSDAATIPASVGAPTDGAGFLTTWMDLCLFNYYLITRVPASFATGSFLVNNGATPQPFAIGQLHFQHPISGATYTNTTSGTITASAVNFPIPVQADGGFPGSAGSFSAGLVPIMLTPISGVVPQATAISLVGTNIETNAAALTRGQNKLGSLSPNGASQAYAYVATTVPTAAAQATAPFPFNVDVFTVSAPITRVAPLVNTATGVVTVYVANSNGAPPGGDITTLAAAIQKYATPLAVTSSVAAVGTVDLNPVFNVWIPQSKGLSQTQVLANINAALSVYCSTTPIGGVSTSAPNIVPYDELVDVIMNANPGTIDLQLLTPAGNLPIGTTSVPVLGTAAAAPPCQVFFV